MANRPIEGSGPVSFTAPSNSKLYYVPLTSLTMTPTGVVDATGWTNLVTTLTGADKDELKKILTALADRGTLRAGASPAPRQAIVFEAAHEGKLGNQITVTITKVTPDPTDLKAPLKATVDLEVVERIELPKVSIDKTAPEFIGTLLSAAKSPGLVKTKTVPDPVLYPKGDKYPEAAGVFAVKQLGVPADNAFVLEPKDPVSGPALVVEVIATDPAQKVFALVITRTATVSAKLSALLSTPPSNPTNPALAHAVFVLAPSGKSDAVAFPAAKQYQLTGGSDEVTTPAAKSSATAFTNG